MVHAATVSRRARLLTSAAAAFKLDVDAAFPPEPRVNARLGLIERSLVATNQAVCAARLAQARRRVVRPSSAVLATVPIASNEPDATLEPGAVPDVYTIPFPRGRVPPPPYIHWPGPPPNYIPRPLAPYERAATDPLSTATFHDRMQQAELVRDQRMVPIPNG